MHCNKSFIEVCYIYTKSNIFISLFYLSAHFKISPKGRVCMYFLHRTCIKHNCLNRYLSHEKYPFTQDII